jgi:hypothetical protein
MHAAHGGCEVNIPLVIPERRNAPKLAKTATGQKNFE